MHRTLLMLRSAGLISVGFLVGTGFAVSKAVTMRQGCTEGVASCPVARVIASRWLQPPALDRRVPEKSDRLTSGPPGESGTATIRVDLDANVTFVVKGPRRSHRKPLATPPGFRGDSDTRAAEIGCEKAFSPSVPRPELNFNARCLADARDNSKLRFAVL
jgi:hypothetical protein